MTANNPDLHALAIALAAQNEVAPDMVILFGSRATGKFHEHSDVDLLVVTRDQPPQRADLSAYRAACAYQKTNPPRLEINIISMTKEDFDCCRKANQHIAGQAARYGIIMSGEGLDATPHITGGYPEHWVATRQRIQNAEEYGRELNQMVDENHWNQKTLGFMAQQAVENALKGWLSAHNDHRTFGHDLTGLWKDLQDLEDWSGPGMASLRVSVNELFDQIRYHDPDSPGEERDWLSKYGVIYRYAGTPYQMGRTERLELQRTLNRAVEGIIERIHDISGTTETDVYPEGIKPWDIDLR